MVECFGCKNLRFHETRHHLFGWWECGLLPSDKAMVGQVGGYNLVCEPPKQVCNGE